MNTKRSEAELRRLVESAVRDACDLERRSLRFIATHVVASGRPPSRLRVWGTLHFLCDGSPFCCGEPGCHLGFTDASDDVNDHVRRSMGLAQQVDVEFGERVDVTYHAGVTFLRC